MPAVIQALMAAEATVSGGGGGTNAKAIDGSAGNKFSSASSGTVTLTTTQANDVVILLVHNEKNASAQTVSTVTSPHLTWARRTAQAWTDTGASSTKENMEIWWAHAGAALSSEVITVTLSGAIDDASMVAFGVSGSPSPSSPWDANGSVPGFANYTGAESASPVTVSGISTNSSVPTAIGFMASAGAGNFNTITPPSGFTVILSEINAGGTNFSISEGIYENFTSALSGASFSATGDFSDFGMVIDALA